MRRPSRRSKRAIEINPNLVLLYFERAQYALLLGDSDAATVAYYNVLVHDENNVKARLRLCELSSLMREREMAIRYCSEVTERAPDWSEGWYRLGMEHFFQGQFAEAQSSLNRCSTLQVMQAVPVDERRFECWYIQGQAAEILGDCANLIALYNEFRAMTAAENSRSAGRIPRKARRSAAREFCNFYPLASYTHIVTRLSKGDNGMSQTLLRRRTSPWAIILIAIGVIWLLAEANIFSAANLSVLFRFWPLILIAFGLELLIGRNNQQLSLLIIGGTVILMLVLMLMGPSMGLAQTTDVKTATYSEPLDGAEAAHVNVNANIAEVRVRPISDAMSDLFDADIEYVGEITYDSSEAARRGSSRSKVRALPG